MKSKILLLLAMVITGFAASAQIPYFVTVAGNGSAAASYPYPTPPATASAFSIPLGTITGTASDDLGNIYFADPGNHIVGMIDASGQLSVIAGTGTSGDGLTVPGSSATATACQLKQPYALYWRSNKLYFSDMGSHSVNVIDLATGTVSRVAGNGVPTPAGMPPPLFIPVAYASLNSPKGIAFDNTGILYIADAGNALIRKVDLNGTSDFSINIFAGNTAPGVPQFSTGSLPVDALTVSLNTGIDGIAVNGDNIMITDPLNHRILVVYGHTITPPYPGSPTKGYMTTSAGNESPAAGSYAPSANPTMTQLDNPKTVTCIGGAVYVGNKDGVVKIYSHSSNYAGDPQYILGLTLQSCSTTLNSTMGYSGAGMEPMGFSSTPFTNEIIFADNTNHLIRRIEAPTESQLHRCTTAPIVIDPPSENIAVFNGALGATVDFKESTSSSWLPLGTGGVTAFSSTSTSIYTLVNGGVGTTYNIRINDPGCTLPVDLADVTVLSSTGPVVVPIMAGTDIAPSGGVLYKTTDACNCGIPILPSVRDNAANYYLEKISSVPAAPSTYTTFPGYYSSPCGSGYLPGGMLGPGDCAGAPIPSVSQTFKITAEKDGCVVDMDGLVTIDDPAHYVTPPTITASTNVISSCTPAVTITVNNPESGKQYRLFSASGVHTHNTSSTSAFSFPPLTDIGGYGVQEFNIAGPDPFEMTSLCSDIIVGTRSMHIDMTSPFHIIGDKSYTICGSGATFSAVLTGTEYTGVVSYSISGPAGYTASASTFSVSAPGNYTITASSSDPTECATSLTITVLADPGGTCSPCSAFTVPGACTDCGSPMAFHTITASSLSQSDIPADGINNIWFNGTKTLNGDVNLTNKIIYVNGSNTINIASTANVALTNCHIFSCGWNGFNVLHSSTSVGRLSLVNSLVENANASSGATAVNISNVTGTFTPTYYDMFDGWNCTFNSQGTVFNQNKVDINVNQAATVSNNVFQLPFRIVNSTFTARNMTVYHDASPTSSAHFYPFVWPGPSVLNAVTTPDAFNPGLGMDTYTMTPASHTPIIVAGGNKDAYGNYYTFSFGDRYNSYGDNVIDNITSSNAITADNANLELFNTIFRKYTDTNSDQAVAIHCTEPSGSSAGAQYKLFLGGDGGSGVGSANGGNEFYNYKSMVRTTGDVDVDIQQTIMAGGYDITSGSGSLPSGNLEACHIEQYAFAMGNVSNNHIYNFQYGVRYTQKYATGIAGYANGAVTVNNNVFEDAPSGGGSGSSKFMMYAVKLVQSTVTTLNGATIDVSGNTIHNAAHGIVLQYYVDNNFAITGNTISIRDYSSTLSSSVFPCHGININTVNHSAISGTGEVSGNMISGPGYLVPGVTLSTASTGTPKTTYGIFLNAFGSSGHLVDVGCNTVADLGIGFAFGATNYCKWTKNKMMRDQVGLFILSVSSMGQQGDLCTPADNMWDNGTAGTGAWPGWPTSSSHIPFHTSTSSSNIYHTYSYYSSSLSPIYYRGYCSSCTGGSPDERYIPYSNGGNGGSTFPYVYGSTFNVHDVYSTCSGISCSTSPLACVGDICSPSYSKPGPGSITTVSLPENGQSYDLYPNPNNGNVKIAQQQPVDGVVHATVLNALGKVVYESNITFSAGQSAIELPDVVTGIYIVELRNDKGQRFTTKMVVEK